MIQPIAKVVDQFVNRLSTKQLLILTSRYGLDIQYKNPQKRKESLQRGLKRWWKKGISDDECAICLDNISFETVIITPCAHMFCDRCIIANLSKSNCCPMCRAVVPYDYIFSQIMNERISCIYDQISFVKVDLTEESGSYMEIRRYNYGACITVFIWSIRMMVLLLVCHIGIIFIQEYDTYQDVTYADNLE